jgi:hypothetical protein
MKKWRKILSLKEKDLHRRIVRTQKRKKDWWTFLWQSESFERLNPEE